MPETHVHRLTNTLDLEPLGDPVMGRRILQFNNDVEIGICIPESRGGVLLPRRRGRRGALRPRGRRGARDDLRLAAVPQARLRRDPARDDLPLPLRRPAALADLLHAGRDRDAEPLPQPLRPAARARAVLAPRLPPAGRARDPPRARRVRPQGARPRRLPGLRPRLPPVRRRRLGRLRLPVHVQHRRLRAQGRPPAPAAAGAPDVPGPELRHLLVLPADARLGRERDRAALPPLQRAVGGDDLLRRRAVRLAQGRRHRGDHAAPVRAAARPAAGAGGEVARRRRGPRSWRSCATRSSRSS